MSNTVVNLKKELSKYNFDFRDIKWTHKQRGGKIKTTAIGLRQLYYHESLDEENNIRQISANIYKDLVMHGLYTLLTIDLIDKNFTLIKDSSNHCFLNGNLIKDFPHYLWIINQSYALFDIKFKNDKDTQKEIKQVCKLGTPDASKTNINHEESSHYSYDNPIDHVCKTQESSGDKSLESITEENKSNQHITEEGQVDGSPEYRRMNFLHKKIRLIENIMDIKEENGTYSQEIELKMNFLYKTIPSIYNDINLIYYLINKTDV